MYASEQAMYADNMMMHDSLVMQTRRGAQWTSLEMDKLLELYTRHYDVLQNKSASTVTGEQKLRIWDTITKEINEVNGNGRTIRTVKIKWTNEQGRVKKLVTYLWQEFLAQQEAAAEEQADGDKLDGSSTASNDNQPPSWEVLLAESLSDVDLRIFRLRSDDSFKVYGRSASSSSGFRLADGLTPLASPDEHAAHVTQDTSTQPIKIEDNDSEQQQFALDESSHDGGGDLKDGNTSPSVNRVNSAQKVASLGKRRIHDPPEKQSGEEKVALSMPDSPVTTSLDKPSGSRQFSYTAQAVSSLNAQKRGGHNIAHSSQQRSMVTMATPNHIGGRSDASYAIGNHYSTGSGRDIAGLGSSQGTNVEQSRSLKRRHGEESYAMTDRVTRSMNEPILEALDNPGSSLYWQRKTYEIQHDYYEARKLYMREKLKLLRQSAQCHACGTNQASTVGSARQAGVGGCRGLCGQQAAYRTCNCCHGNKL